MKTPDLSLGRYAAGSPIRNALNHWRGEVGIEPDSRLDRRQAQSIDRKKKISYNYPRICLR